MGLRLHWLQIAALAVMLGSVASCSEQKMPTQVMVLITAEPELASQVETVRVQVFYDGDPLLSDSEGTIDGTSIREGTAPVAIPLLPLDGDAARRYEVTAVLFDAEGGNLGTQTISGGYVQNELREVSLVFEDACLDELCPEGFRCYDGDCAEYCVEPAVVGTVQEASPPVACGEPCTAPVVCRGDEGEQNVLRCSDGYGVIEQECGFGCDLDETAACNELIPSNVGDGFEWEPGLAELVVGEDGALEVVFNTETGAVVADPGTEAETEIRAAGVGNDSGISFQQREDPPALYGVFSLDGLTVREGATLRGEGEGALILMVTRKVSILGAVDVAATDTDPGPGGFRGGEGEDGEPSEGEGPGGGKPGMPVDSFPSSGGGGASFGGFGGLGGVAGFTDALIAPGNRGALYGTIELSPLVGGSGGGEGGTDGSADGGHGGGALQISTNGRIRVGPDGIVTAGGGGGHGLGNDPGVGNGNAGAGAGSGGAILFEAGKLVFIPGSSTTARIGALGGGGGGIGRGNLGAPGESDGSVGDPRQVPAAGGIALGPDGEGGAGSNDDGRAEDGGFFNLGGGGGGGGGGRIRVNTQNGESDRSELELFVTPSSEPMGELESTFTVGKADVR